ncbi:hypothetical protein ABIC65_003619 [Sphingomonas trueperi]
MSQATPPVAESQPAPAPARAPRPRLGLRYDAPTAK